MLDYNICKTWPFPDVTQTYTERDTMLYALGLGIGADPMDSRQLKFVYEQTLQAIPTMAAVLGSPKMWLRDPRTGADVVKLVHGEQHLQMFKTFPTAATVVARNKVVSVTDKGEGKGALIVTARQIIDQSDDSLIAECRNVSFLRGDGGFSKASGVSDPGPEQLPPLPDRKADAEVTLSTLPQAALIYRLSGDYNPLHADPAVAKAAGFDRPILHGLCTYGMGAYAVISTLLENDAARLIRFGVRFTAPVWPAESVRFEFWREDGNIIRLRANVDRRNAVVLNNGVVAFR